MTRLSNAALRKPSIPDTQDYYKRVVIAVRLKRDDKLTLKAFKDVPVNALEQLMPTGRIRMPDMNRLVMTSSVAMASLGLLAKFVTVLAHTAVEWTTLASLAFALTAARVFTVYKNRRSGYLQQLNRMLYFKNIANNRGLLTLVVDRAEDELFKEAMLTYTHLLANRPQTQFDKTASQQDLFQLGQCALLNIRFISLHKCTMRPLHYTAASADVISAYVILLQH